MLQQAVSHDVDFANHPGFSGPFPLDIPHLLDRLVVVRLNDADGAPLPKPEILRTSRFYPADMLQNAKALHHAGKVTLPIPVETVRRQTAASLCVDLVDNLMVQQRLLRKPERPLMVVMPPAALLNRSRFELRWPVFR